MLLNTFPLNCYYYDRLLFVHYYHNNIPRMFFIFYFFKKAVFDSLLTKGKSLRKLCGGFIFPKDKLMGKVEKEKIRVKHYRWFEGRKAEKRDSIRGKLHFGKQSLWLEIALLSPINPTNNSVSIPLEEVYGVCFSRDHLNVNFAQNFWGWNFWWMFRVFAMRYRWNGIFQAEEVW